MDNESDGDEFYDATEDFASVSTRVEEGSTITSCQDIEPSTSSKTSSTVSIVSDKHQTEVEQHECGLDLVDGDNATKLNDTDQKATTNDANKNNVVKNYTNTTMLHSNIKDGTIYEDKCEISNQERSDECVHRHEMDENNSEGNIISGMPRGNEDKYSENKAKTEMFEQNTTPVAPPRRKKKNKKRQEPEQNLKLTHEKAITSTHEKAITSTANTEKHATEENKNNELTNEAPQATFENNEDECVATEDPVYSDLDISTQEMSEILDRNNYSEVVSPPHFSVHLQRNKSQSISSIGSFCSVSSNLSTQDKIKRSGSQVSLGSLEKSSVAVDQLTDQEILEQVVVKNLDTGECIPLSLAEKHVPTGVNPLALHIMRLTSEFSSKQDLATSDREDVGDGGVNETIRKISRKKKNLRGLFGRKVQKLKTTKDGSKRADESSSSDEESPQHPDSYIKIKSANGKGIPIINKLHLIQDLSGQHQGAVWTMKFSCCGKLLATAGQDKVVHVWVLKNEKLHFEQMREKYAKADSAVSPTDEKADSDENTEKDKDPTSAATETDYPEGFCKEPFCTYRGHIGDVLDLSWSKNYFLLSSSMDKTVRLWHISRNECLCCFQHIDFVTAITFHPRDDRYFLSGSLDGKIRLWNIPDKKVALWNELEGAGSNLITAANFCMNGKFAVVGTYDGRCIFYETEHLKYFTQWQVRSSRKKQGRKISGIEPMPGEEKILITSNDSRIRLYSLKDHTLQCKYKGFTNSSSQIKGSFSHDGEFVIAGSEDHYVYMWRAQHRIPSSRKDRNDFYESFSAHNAVVTAAIFAPCPWNVVPTEYEENSSGTTGQEVIVAADWTGAIKIFINKYQNEKLHS